MKRLYFFFLAGVAAITVSCQQEQPVTPESPIDENDFEIVGVIHNADETPNSKTAYTLNGADLEHSTSAIFSWAQNDEIKLIVYKDDAVPNHYRLQAESSSPTTTFKKNGGSTQDPIGNAVDGWKHTGFAIYPVDDPETGKGSNSTLGGLTYAKQTGDGKTNADISLTIPSGYTLTSLDNQLSAVPMVGIQRDNGTVPATEKYYDFYAGAGVLAFTISDVPTTAISVRLTSFSDDEPLAGTFNMVKGTPDISMANVATPSLTKTITLPSRAEKEDITVYFPLPVGTITHGLRIELLDDTSYPIFKKRYSASLNIERGVIKTVSLSAPDWKKLGTGKFIDTHLWGKMGFGTNTFDEVGAVNVDIYQNVSDHTQYRIFNPYGQASAYLTAESESQGEHDEYLTFVIPAEGNITFVDHKTGYTVSGENVTIKHVDSSHNKIAAGTRSTPLIVQLAPDYKGTASFDENCKDADNKLQIIFPAALEAYGGSATIKDNKADLSSGIDYSKGASAEKVCIYLSNTPIFDAFSQATTSTSISTGPGSRSTRDSGSNVAAATLGYGAKSGSSYDQTKSGAKYLTWSTWNNNDGNILYMVGCRKFYGIVPSDVTTYIGDYTMYSGDGSTSIPMVLAVSDDPARGNVKMTSFASISGSLYGVYNSSIGDGNFQFKNSRTTEFASNVYVYSNNTNDLADLNFAVGYDSHTSANYGSRNWDVISWNAFIKLNNNGVITQYDFLRGDKYWEKKIDLTGKIIASSKISGQGEDKLVDKCADTQWHSVYSGEHNLDETYGVYLDIDLGESKTVSNFTIKFLTRSNISHGVPTKYIIYGHGESDWEPLIEEQTISGASGTWFEKSVSSANSYRKLRLSITESNGSQNGSLKIATAESDHGYTHLSELQLWEN